MARAKFQTNHLDLALTKLAAGCDVDYTGPHEGVYRFESVKLRALMSRDGMAPEGGFEAALNALIARSRCDASASAVFQR